jgi:hypothetical protein
MREVTPATDDRVRALAGRGRPLSLVLLHWSDGRDRTDAAVIEGAHQRRMVGLHDEGVIAVLCPVTAGAVAGMAVVDLPVDEARQLMDGDPCVQAGMMRCEVHPCLGFPGDAVPD